MFDLLNIDLPDVDLENNQTILIQTSISEKIKHEQIIGQLAKKSGIKHLVCIDYFDMIGLNDLQICSNMKDKYLDASKTTKSLVIINHLDCILNASNRSVLQTVITLLKYYKNVITIVTTSEKITQIDKKNYDKLIVL